MRSIITKKDAIAESIVLQSEGNTQVVTPDTYIDRVIKYIPAETISAYTMFQKTMEQFKESVPFLLFYILFAVIFVGNFFYLKKLQGVKKPSQLIVMSIAFLIWAYTLGEPFKSLMKVTYQPVYSVLGILIFSFLVPLFQFDKNHDIHNF